MSEFAENDPQGRLDATSEYGRHIGLTCRNHPQLRWNTKNIAPLGCRSLFFDGPGPECDCPLSSLELLNESDD